VGWGSGRNGQGFFGKRREVATEVVAGWIIEVRLTMLAPWRILVGPFGALLHLR
jgi:hypothetical protein